TLDGGEEHALLTLVRAPTVPVAGRVVSRHGVPLAGVRVALGRQLDWPQSDPIGKQVLGFPLRGQSAGWCSYDDAVTTGDAGRSVLPPLVPRGAFLALRGKALVLGESYSLDGARDLAALEIPVDASSRSRLELARASEADQFGLLDARGEVHPLFIEVEGVT